MKYFHVKMIAFMLVLSFEGAIMDLYRPWTNMYRDAYMFSMLAWM